MKNTLILVLFPLFAIGVFGAVELKSVSVSVKEGDSVTLNTGVQIQGNDLIEWRLNGKLLFRISSSAGNISVSDRTDGAFRDRLKLNNTTGDLKITNFRNTDAGEYKLKIRSNTSSDTTFSVTGESDRDSVKFVTEGESITLKTQIQSDEVKWRFGAENTLIAEINVTANGNPQYHDVLDGRFRDRLTLDNHTGSLTITNITDTDFGVYEADISNSSSFTIHKIFTVTVEDSGLSPDAIAGIVSAPVLFAAVVVVMIYRWMKSKPEQPKINEPNPEMAALPISADEKQ